MSFKNSKNQWLLIALGLVLCAVNSTVRAAATGFVSYNGPSYTQDFNSLPSTPADVNAGTSPTISGVTYTLTPFGNLAFSLSDTSIGSGGVPIAANMDGWWAKCSVADQLGAQAGGQTKGGLISYGPSGNANRAIGLLATNTSGITQFAVALKNTSASSYNQLSLSYTSQLWHQQTNANPLNFTYFIDTANATPVFPASGTTLGSLTCSFPTGASTGVVAAPIASNSLSVTKSPIGTWGVGQILWLVWTISNDDGGGQGIAIDTLTMSADFSASAAPIVLTGLPANLSGALGDPNNPTYTFSASDALTPTSALSFSVASSDPVVAPPANVTFTTSGNNVTVSVNPAAVGYSNITVTVTDPNNINNVNSGILHYAASGLNSINHDTAAVPTLGTSTRYFYGMSDASGAVANPNDANTFVIADDEAPNNAYLYDIRKSSYTIVTPYDFSPGNGAPLRLPDAGKECDLEGLMLIGSRAFFVGSGSNDSGLNVAVNRSRIFAMDLGGTGSSTTLTFAGRFDNIRNEIIGWDKFNKHSLGAGHYGLEAAGAVGQEAKSDHGFDFEGLAQMPSTLTGAYMAFRAPIVGAGKHALLLAVTNFTTMATSLSANDPNSVAAPNAGPSGAQGTAPTFGTPAELDLGGRGVRDIVRNSFDEYLLIGGSTGDPANTKDFRLFTWDGVAGHPAIMLDSKTRINQPGMSLEAILAPLPAGHLAGTSQAWLISDNGTYDFYGDGQQAKDLAQNLQKSRADLVSIGNPVITVAGTFPSVVVNAVYSNQVTATDSSATATGAPTFSILSGALPGGLSISASGLISGTPTAVGTFTFTVMAAYSDGQGLAGIQNFSLIVTASVPVPGPPGAVIFASAPTATPNPAIVGQGVQFSALATGTEPIVYAWSFGDGAADAGANVSHMFSPAKAYTVTVVATDAANLTATATVALTVNPAVGGSSGSGSATLTGEIDSDGDGFSDAVEAASGTDPLDLNSHLGSGAPILSEAVIKPVIKISKKKVLTLTGALHIPADFTASGKTVVVDVAGYTQKFLLNTKNAGKTVKDTFSVKIALKKKKVLAQNAKFKLLLNAVPDTVKTNSPFLIVVGATVFKPQ